MLTQLRSLANRNAPSRDSADLRHRELERALEAAAKALLSAAYLSRRLPPNKRG
jgi:hypothetical protein